MINVLFIIFLWIELVAACNPDESLFQLYIVYKEDSSPQSLDILDVDSETIVYQFNGYGKDNTVDSHSICLKSKVYRVITRDGLRNGWPVGSYFGISAGYVIDVLQGSCDFGGTQEFEFYASVPLPLCSDWLFQDFVTSLDWYQSDFDDSQWNIKHFGEFPDYVGNRYYRIHMALDEAALQAASSLIIGLHGRNTTSLYLNGQTIFENKYYSFRILNRNTTVIVTEANRIYKSEEYFIFSVPANVIQSASLVIAVTSNCETSVPMDDAFDLTLILVTSNSNRILNAQASSPHSMDFYSNPLSLAMDHNRGSFWKIRGNNAVLYLQLNGNRVEYVNTLSITAGNDPFLAPTWIVISGCVREDRCSVVGKVDGLDWHGVSETQSIYFNELNESFYQIILQFANEKEEIRIGEIALTSTPLQQTLQYPSTITHVLDTSFLFVAPLYSVFTHFTINPSLPEGLQLSSTGVIMGFPRESSMKQYTIEAMTLGTNQTQSVVVPIRIQACNGDDVQLLEVELVQRLWSNNLWWSLVDGEGHVLVSEQGSNCGDREIHRLYHYCLPAGDYSLVQTVGSHTGVSSGSLILRFQQPFIVGKEYVNLAVLPVVMNGSSKTSQFNFTTSYLLSSQSEWMCNTDYYTDRFWYTTKYPEDDRWFPVVTSQLPPNSLLRLRKWIQISRQSIESVNIVVSSTCKVTMYCNGQFIVEQSSVSLQKGLFIQLTADQFNEGKNLIALRLSCEAQSPSLVFRVQEHRNSSFTLTSREVTMESKDTEPSSSTTSIMDGNLATDWVGLMTKSEISLQISFFSTYLQTVNTFCITNSLRAINADPGLFKIRGKFMDNRWVVLSSYSDIFFQNRGERRCFLIPYEYRNLPLSAVRLDFQRQYHQEQIAISEISFYSNAFSNKELPPFAYGRHDIDIIRGIDFPSLPTPSSLYCKYWSDELPEGLVLDTMNGQLLGKVYSAFLDRSVTIHAMTISGDRVFTTLVFNSKECEDPFSFLEITLSDLDNTSFFLSFDVIAVPTHMLLARISVIPTSPSISYLFCVEKGLYALQFTDKTNSGFVNTVYTLTVDHLLVQSGKFNPGFSTFQLPFAAGFLLPSHSLWYYSVDNSDPPANWFATIDPVHEPWEVAYPGAFPSPQGHAQYFKTVLELSHTSYKLRDFVSFVIRVTVKGGAIVYLNKQEILRHALPEGEVTRHTLPLSSFRDWTVLKVVTSIEFAFTTEEVIPIAVELHDFLPEQAAFSLNISLQPDNTLCQMKPLITYENVPFVDHPEHIYDSQFYNKAVFHGNCKNVRVMMDLQNLEYFYVTKFCLFSGNTAGEFPRSVSFQGGVYHPRENVTDWEDLYSVNDLSLQRNTYGESRCFHFYNTRIYSQFRFVFNGCKRKNEMEIAEIQFFGKRLDGFCEWTVNGTRSQTPDKEWKILDCPPLYSGRIFIFCENGNWTKTANYCIPTAPQAFHYNQNVFLLRRHRFVQIVPSVIGTELLFTINVVPKGMMFDPLTGILEGVYKENEVTMSCTVTVMNAGGKQQTSFGISIVNYHEEWYLVIALLFVAILVSLIGYFYQLSKQKRKPVKSGILCTEKIPEAYVRIFV